MNILVFAPHNDDEVLGVGGTIKKAVDQGHSVYVCEATSGKHFALLQQEARKAHTVLGVRQSYFLNLPVGGLRNMNQMDLNAKVSAVVRETSPEVVYIPFIGDMHFDHRELTESAMVALRPIGTCPVREIYMYETLSETGWNLPSGERAFIPNVWIDISDTIEDKLRAMKCYESQLLDYPHPRSEEAIRSLAKYRGSTVGVPYAESFMLVRKIDRSAARSV